MNSIEQDEAIEALNERVARLMEEVSRLQSHVLRLDSERSAPPDRWQSLLVERKD